ncbi:MAG TPA: MFS transporter [Microbacteriaceae bacterium]|jgi:EmrB/QacA subfamily drug resistance transporter|nr:MFS transporter [Microbacteriaceae bacterium]HRA09858.1 MFS transporter [Microbacteriaceae bacterium]
MVSRTRAQSPARSRVIVLIAVGAAFMSGLDLFVVNVAFDQIGVSLGVGTDGGPTIADMSWILNIYAVVYAALLVPLGRIADRYGRKTVFVGGLALFVAASAACALSGNVWMLVLFRGLQAAGAAAMTPTSLSILMAALPPEKRIGGVRMWSATGAAAAALGPTIGGFLTGISWHWVFLINLPIGVVLLWLAVRHVRDTEHDEDAKTPDLLGALLLAAAVGLFALGLVQSPEWGWGSPATLGALAASVVFAFLFVVRSRRHAAPVIDPRLLRVRSFMWANASMLIFNVAFAANTLIFVLWMQQVWGWSPLLTGLAIAPGPAMVPITVALTSRFLRRARPERLASVGAVLVAVATVYIALSAGSEANYWLGYFPGTIVSGMGVGLASPNLMAAATHNLPPAQSSTGTGMSTMARQIGYVIGISMLFAIVGSMQALGPEVAFRTVLLVSVGVLLISSLTAFGVTTARHATPAAPTRAPATPSPEEASEPTA